MEEIRMRKTGAVLAALLLAAAAQLFAMKSTPDFALGAEITCIDLHTVGAMLSVHLPGMPLYIGVGGDFYNEPSGETELAATIDGWLLHSSKGYFNFYLGFGLYGAMTADQSWYSAGLRLPLGVQIWPMNTEELEMFLEVAPAWVPITADGEDWDKFQAQLALGLRFWFDR
jgi:hypothetical protein